MHSESVFNTPCRHSGYIYKDVCLEWCVFKKKKNGLEMICQTNTNNHTRLHTSPSGVLGWPSTFPRNLHCKMCVCVFLAEHIQSSEWPPSPLYRASQTSANITHWYQFPSYYIVSNWSETSPVLLLKNSTVTLWTQSADHGSVDNGIHAKLFISALF